MELIYLIIFLISCLIEDIDNVLLKKTHIKAFKYEKILHISEEPSLLQCAQKCKFIDKNAIVDFQNSKCTCVKYEDDDGQQQEGTLTGVFVNQKIMKAKTMEQARSTEPPQSTKPTLTPVINVAFDKTAIQSTTLYDNSLYAANKAIDGSESTNSGTKEELNQWWTVDLKTTTDIMYMVLKGQIGSRHNRALIIETRKEKNEAWITCKYIGDLKSKPFNFTCGNPRKARFVKIKSASRCFIGLYEFEVYARVAV